MLPDGTVLPGYTANFWWGCQRVSPGCERCYAEQLAVVRRKLPVWGPPKTTERQRKKGVWHDVVKWNRDAAKDGVRRRMFVSSMSDIFEDHPQVIPWRAEALALLEKCTSLDVQLLTKRPQSITRMVPPAWLDKWPAHVWVGTTVEDQKRAEERIPELLKVPARVRFLSCEPLLSAVNLNPPICPRCDGCESTPGDDGATPFCVPCGESDGNGEEMEYGGWLDACADESQRGISWVIVGGESGPSARPFDVEWARSIVGQCRDAGVPVFVKQMGDNPTDTALVDIFAPDGTRHYTRPFGDPDVDEALKTTGYTVQIHRPKYKAHHGADMREWPEFLRRQQFPTAAP